MVPVVRTKEANEGVSGLQVSVKERERTRERGRERRERERERERERCLALRSTDVTSPPNVLSYNAPGHNDPNPSTLNPKP